jgi:hypothetical protein
LNSLSAAITREAKAQKRRKYDCVRRVIEIFALTRIVRLADSEKTNLQEHLGLCEWARWPNDLDIRSQIRHSLPAIHSS